MIYEAINTLITQINQLIILMICQTIKNTQFIIFAPHLFKKNFKLYINIDFCIWMWHAFKGESDRGWPLCLWFSNACKNIDLDFSVLIATSVIFLFNYLIFAENYYKAKNKK